MFSGSVGDRPHKRYLKPREAPQTAKRWIAVEDTVSGAERLVANVPWKRSASGGGRNGLSLCGRAPRWAGKAQDPGTIDLNETGTSHSWGFVNAAPLPAGNRGRRFQLTFRLTPQPNILFAGDPLGTERAISITQQPIALAAVSPFSSGSRRQTAARIPVPCTRRSHPGGHSPGKLGAKDEVCTALNQ